MHHIYAVCSPFQSVTAVSGTWLKTGVASIWKTWSMIPHCESTHESMICTHRLPNFLHSNYTNCISVTSCRLGGVIAAYKIVPDEIDEIKVRVLALSSLNHPRGDEMDTNMLWKQSGLYTPAHWHRKCIPCEEDATLNFVCVCVCVLHAYRRLFWSGVMKRSSISFSLLEELALHQEMLHLRCKHADTRTIHPLRKPEKIWDKTGGYNVLTESLWLSCRPPERW